MQSSEARESRARFDGGTYTLRPKSGDRKSLVDDGRWLSLDRRANTKSQVKQTSASTVTSAARSAETKNGASEGKRSVSRSPSRAKSREKSRSPSRGKSQEASDQEERDARSFWVSMDSSSQAQTQEVRKSSSMSRKTSEKQSSKKLSRSSVGRKISDEPPVDYDQEDSKKSKNSKIKRGSQVTKRQMESNSSSNTLSESKVSSAEQQRYNMNTVNNEDYNRGTNYPVVKHSTGARQESNGDTLKRNSASLSRRGTIIDSNINRDGFGRDNEHNNAVAIRSRNGSNANDSKHFLSLQLFNKVMLLIHRRISCECCF